MWKKISEDFKVSLLVLIWSIVVIVFIDVFI